MSKRVIAAARIVAKEAKQFNRPTDQSLMMLRFAVREADDGVPFVAQAKLYAEKNGPLAEHFYQQLVEVVP